MSQAKKIGDVDSGYPFLLALIEKAENWIFVKAIMIILPNEHTHNTYRDSLIHIRNQDEVRLWMDSLNVSAALLSAPPLPAPVGSA